MLWWPENGHGLVVWVHSTRGSCKPHAVHLLAIFREIVSGMYHRLQGFLILLAMNPHSAEKEVTENCKAYSVVCVLHVLPLIQEASSAALRRLVLATRPNIKRFDLSKPHHYWKTVHIPPLA